jgi:hypothetical protein
VVNRPAGKLPVGFQKGATRRYTSLFRRDDGVLVAFEGGSYTPIGGSVGELPHDMAHLIVEREFCLRGGVWGTLAAGGLFKRATRIVEGRQLPHAARRGRELVVAAHDSIIQAEVTVRVVCEASTRSQAIPVSEVGLALNQRGVSGATDVALTRSFDCLRDAAPTLGTNPGRR